ncbi:hypothetical protein NC651_019197 [Populus alba x Populus x berolinensis]|nr:hypothetical protein NC651_019197 [Populus alba x Populus x berolinensis]
MKLSNHLCRDRIKLGSQSGEKLIDSAKIIQVNAVERPDGVIHGIERLLIPRSVQQDFNNRRSLQSISAVKPEGAPEVDPRTHRLKKPAPPAKPGSAPVIPIYDAMAPGPSLAPAPAPGPGGPHHHFNGERQFLAPNDEAMAKLTTDQLSEPGAPEQIIYYHVIPEYQTEESMYNAVRRFGKISYDTLRLPHKVLAQEADGRRRNRITKTEMKSVKVAAKPQRRGKLLEVACRMLGTFGQDSHFTTCQNTSKKDKGELLRSCKVLVSEFSSLQIGSSFSHGKPTTKGEMGSWCDDVLIYGGGELSGVGWWRGESYGGGEE